MEIRVNEDNGAKIFEVEGRIDTTTAPELEKKLLAELEGVSKLRMDMGKVEYVSSAGLRVFLNAQKYCNKNGVALSFFGIAETVMEVFEITGFADILSIE